MKIFYSPLTLLASALMLQPLAASAQSSEEEDFALIYGDKSTVSIATGSQQPLRRAPSVTTVITAEDIAAIGATDLDDVLETVPGMHVTRSVTYTPLYITRGIGTNPNDSRMLMLQNGIPVTTMYLGDKGQSWGGLPLENIARIEIIRGPGSALYGADAFSGAINIITKTAADIAGTQVGARYGTFKTRDAWVQHGGTYGAVDVAAYLRIGKSNGADDTITADAQTRRDKIFGTHASLAPGPIHTGRDAVDANVDVSYDKWRLRSGYKLRDNLGVGAGVAFALDPVGLHKSERLNTDLSWIDSQIVKDWGVGVTASYLRYSETLASNYQLSPPGTVFPTGAFPDGMIGDPDRHERQTRLSSFANYSGIPDHNLRFGMGHDDLNMYATATHKNYRLNAAGVPVPTGPVIDYSIIQPHLPTVRRKISYIYAQDEWRFAPDWALTAGVRHDRYSDFGGTTNPRAALVWDASLNLTAKLLYGQAFRAPSFNEQYGTNPVTAGNPDLLPESIHTLETAFTWRARPDTEVNLSIFHYQMDDLIRAVPNIAPAPGATAANTGGQHGGGLELEVVWDASRDLRISGNYAYQRSIDEATGRDPGYAPHSHIYVRGDWHMAGNWVVSPQVNRVAGRERAAGDVRPPVADYTTLDLTLHSKLVKDQWDFSFSIRNLFDADAREPSLSPGTIPNDFPVAPRTVFVQATYRM